MILRIVKAIVLLFAIFVLTLPFIYIISPMIAFANDTPIMFEIRELRLEFGVDDIPKLMKDLIDYIKGIK